MKPETVKLPGKDNCLQVIDMHTGGEPVRIITSGYPEIEGTTLLDKRRYVRKHLDHFRHFVIDEPRGHRDMYGVLLVTPDHPEADLAVLFMHNEGYSTMCGHAVIALGRYAVDFGLVQPVEPKTKLAIQCPCGLVQVEVSVQDGKSSDVSFLSVPSFMFLTDLQLTLEDGRSFMTDIAYGGAFYAILDAAQFGMNFEDTPVSDFIKTAQHICKSVNETVSLFHPDHDDLAFLYGAIFTDGHDQWSHSPTKNICIFADQQVDRSPTGSGVSARLAIARAKGLFPRDSRQKYQSIIGSSFIGEVARTTRCGDFDAIIARVSGHAHYCGSASFWHEEDDLIGRGFSLS